MDEDKKLQKIDQLGFFLGHVYQGYNGLSNRAKAAILASALATTGVLGGTIYAVSQLPYDVKIGTESVPDRENMDQLNPLWRGGQDGLKEASTDEIKQIIPTLKNEKEIKVYEAVLAYWENDSEKIALIDEKTSQSNVVRYASFIHAMREDDFEKATQIISKAIEENDFDHPELWDSNNRRVNLTRWNMRQNNFEAAYLIASNVRIQSEQPSAARVELEWLAGSIQFKQEDFKKAESHFQKSLEASTISRSIARNQYYLGRTYEAMENEEKSKQHYERAARLYHTMHGQLALEELGRKLEVPATQVISEDLSAIQAELSRSPLFETAMKQAQEGNANALNQTLKQIQEPYFSEVDLDNPE
jgi:tetratricopeptide (TPR) repeat protein